MMRLIAFLGLVFLVVAGIGWLAADPGRLVFTIRGWQVETSVGVAAFVVAAGMVGLVLIYSVIAAALAAPRRYRAWALARRRERGLRHLARGMVAVAAGDAPGARRSAGRAEALLDAAPLTLLLSAQAAQLEGDEGAAEKYFNTMLDQPDMEFLGLRGLLLQAGRAGDDARALAYAERAAQVRPDAPWVHRMLFDLAVKARLWGEAEAALAQAVRRGGIDRATGARHRAAILLQQSFEADEKGFPTEARELAKRARRASPAFVPAALRLALMDKEGGRERSARRILERAYKSNPHPDIANTYSDFAKGETETCALDRVRLMERLLKLQPDHPESHLAVAQAALGARLWGDARAHSEAAEKQFNEEGAGAPARLYRLLAQVEEEEKGDSAAARHWLMRAGDAAPDSRWICASCGGGFPSWTALCPECQGFDCLEWRVPDDGFVVAPPLSGDVLSDKGRVLAGSSFSD